MEYIKVDGKLYDPYYILNIARDDDDEQVIQAFRRRVKKFHPDKCRKSEEKDKYERLFRVIMKSFEYIKKKRALRSDRCDIEYKYNDDTNYKPLLDVPGYGNHQRLEDIKLYDEFDVNIANQFKHKKFSNKEFNLKFEYVKSASQESKEDKQLVIHKTSDGFYGSNSGDTSSCALVSSFNGLLITRDNDGAYLGNGYSDYKIAHEAARNPSDDIMVPKGFTLDAEKPIQSKSLKRETITIPRGGFEDQLKILYEKNLKRLKKEMEKDQNIVTKHAYMYNKEIVQDAIDDRLEKTPSYLEHLDEHYKKKRLGQ